MTSLPLSKALLRIILSVLLISGPCALALSLYQHFRQKQRLDPSFTIVAVVQTSPESEGLKTVYFTELLGLSIDHPKNLYDFSIAEAEQKLLHSPLIKEAKVRKIRPGTIHVDYQLRKPIAFLADYTNTALDEEGFIFPFKPFFTPKKLPEIYLGGLHEKGALWGVQLADDNLQLAFELIRLADRHCCDACSSLLKIDLSRLHAASAGRSQIVMVFEERSSPSKIFTHTLRLTSKNILQELANYCTLRDYFRKNPKSQKNSLIDLRLANLAFIGPDE
jgi:hypothetical protein